jgi:hypothetical protein
MRTSTVRIVQSLAPALMATLLSLATPATAATWVPPNNSPPASGFFDTCLLLTDGTIMCHEILGFIPGVGATHPERWHRLSPDPKNSYTNGTWDNPPIADMPPGSDAALTGCTPNCTYGPLFFSSSLLPDGKVVVIGGEDDINQAQGSDTNIGFIYDPVHDNGNCAGCGSWSAQLAPPTNSAMQPIRVGDAMGIVLQDGTFVLADINTSNMYTLNEGARSFTALNPLLKNDANSEEGWNILPDGTLLTVDASVTSVFEIYCPSSVPSCVTAGTANTWTNGITPVNFPNTGPNTTGSIEVGPAITRPDGTVVQFSANPNGLNGVYQISTSSWVTSGTMNFPVAPTGLPDHFAVADGPAAPLLDGNVLVMASPDSSTTGPFNKPSHFYEFSLTDNTLSAQLTDTPNASNFRAFDGHMLVIPTGEVLLTACNQNGAADVQFYENGGTFQDAWRPVITSVVPTHIAPGASYAVSGTLFNGYTQGATFGDDSQSASNYPLVRITNNATSDVSYARTHDHSRMGVEAVGSTATTTTHFDTRGDLENGPSMLVVVTNGIPSQPVAVNVFPNTPPVAVCKPFTTSASAACLGSIVPSNIDGGSSDPDGDPLSFSVAPPGPFGLGGNQVTLTVTDPSGASASCVATVTVVDTTPPMLQVPGPVSAATCTDGATVQVGQATATDNCATNLKPTGQVIAKNGIPITPIPVVNGQVTLGIGTFTIRWTVSDGANPPVTGNQTVVVGTKIQASHSFLLDDRAQVQNGTGGSAAVLNSGTALTQIGNDSRSGAILSVGAVNILHRAVVNGNVTSASTVTKATDGTVNGSITMNASVVLPPLPTLPAFPPPTLGGFTVNSGTTQSHPAGSYTSATVINGGTLILGTGDYFFQSLTINSGSTVRVTPTTRVFVQNTLIFNAPFRATSGTAVQAITLGFAGANLSLLAQFNGTLIAPNADVMFGTGAGITYTGSFFGRTLEVTPASILVCSLN